MTRAGRVLPSTRRPQGGMTSSGRTSSLGTARHRVPPSDHVASADRSRDHNGLLTAPRQRLGSVCRSIERQQLGRFEITNRLLLLIPTLRHDRWHQRVTGPEGRRSGKNTTEPPRTEAKRSSRLHIFSAQWLQEQKQSPRVSRVSASKLNARPLRLPRQRRSKPCLRVETETRGRLRQNAEQTCQATSGSGSYISSGHFAVSTSIATSA